MAVIIRLHMPMNEDASPHHVCPGIRIHAIDIVQLPGIGIPGVLDIDEHDTIVRAALIMNIEAQSPRSVRSEPIFEQVRGSMVVRLAGSRLPASNNVLFIARLQLTLNSPQSFTVTRVLRDTVVHAAATNGRTHPDVVQVAVS
jgi:hypothetical protein